MSVKEHSDLGISAADLSRLSAIEQLANHLDGNVAGERVQCPAHVFLRVRQLSHLRQPGFHVDLDIGSERLETRTVLDQRLQRLAVGTGKVEGHQRRDSKSQQRYQQQSKSVSQALTDQIPLWNKDTNPKFLFRPQIVAPEAAPPHFALVRKLKGLQILLLTPEADAFGEKRHRDVLRTFEQEAAQFLPGLGGRNQHPAIIRQNEHLSIPRDP